MENQNQKWYAHLAYGNNPQTYVAPTTAVIEEYERLPITEGPFDSKQEAADFISDYIDRLREQEYVSSMRFEAP